MQQASYDEKGQNGMGEPADENDETILHWCGTDLRAAKDR